VLSTPQTTFFILHPNAAFSASLPRTGQGLNRASIGTK
jgi:hypothetical protein